MQGVLACRKHFQAQDAAILLVSTLKSGTTWLKAILFALVKRVHYHPDPQQHPLLTNNPHVFVPFLELNLYIEKEVPDLTSYSPARLFSTHLPLVSLPESVKRLLARSFICVEIPRTRLFHFGTSQTVENLRPESMGTNSPEEALEKFCRGVSVHGPVGIMC